MNVFHADNLSKVAGVGHGFFGREGGVSSGIYASLNCGPGSGDQRSNVVENRGRVARHLGATALLGMHQIHSGTVTTVTKPWDLGRGPLGDAMVTATPGLALGILTADCAPVLFADAEAKVIGAAHAGWKGALGGVTDSTIAAMEKLGARRDRIAAAVGPCISQPNYEVGPEFRDRFLEADSHNARFFIASDRPEHHRFDLEGYVVHRLRNSGIGDVVPLQTCTYARDSEFFSFRRTTHRGEADYGREISAIVLI